PKSEGELVRCCYESLALKYREVLHSLEELTGETIDIIHIVGGGSQSQLLNQFTADACQRPVLAGPVEATAMGNLLTQIKADGELKSLGEMRDVVRASSARSEEHTSELQSRENLVCRLLLEKKKEQRDNQ